ncbi:hypothetical protein MRX96_034987 [Rhipicephalus microplus]
MAVTILLLNLLSSYSGGHASRWNASLSEQRSGAKPPDIVGRADQRSKSQIRVRTNALLFPTRSLSIELWWRRPRCRLIASSLLGQRCRRRRSGERGGGIARSSLNATTISLLPTLSSIVRVLQNETLCSTRASSHSPTPRKKRTSGCARPRSYEVSPPVIINNAH